MQNSLTLVFENFFRLKVVIDEEYDEDEYDDESEEYDEEVEEADAIAETIVVEYVDPYFMSPAIQMYATFGCMMFGRRIELFSPMVVRILRYVQLCCC